MNKNNKVFEELMKLDRLDYGHACAVAGWNAAIEAVIKLINDDKYYDISVCVMEDEIRKLKK